MSTQLLNLGFERWSTIREAIDTSTYEGSMGSERTLSRYQAGGDVGVTERMSKIHALDPT